MFVLWLEVKLQVIGCFVTYHFQNVCVCVCVCVWVCMRERNREKENCAPALAINPLILKTFIPFNHDHEVPMPHGLSCLAL